MITDSESKDSNLQGDRTGQAPLPAAYPYPLDAVVLAGTDGNPKRLIAGRNKAFLEIGGKRLVRYVVDALLAAENIGHVFVVGPAGDLLEVLARYSGRVQVIAQRGKMLTNCWAGIEASEDLHRHDARVPLNQRPILFVSCDLPLVTARSIDDFIRRCAEQDRAARHPVGMHAGVVDEPSVRPFRPDGENPGIERPFVELEFGRLRLANIYVGRPRILANQDFLQTGFSYRKAKDWRNVIALTFNFFKSQGGWQAAWMTVRIQLTLMLSKGKGYWYRRLKRGNTREKVEKSCSEVLGGPVKIIVTPFGGLSLDVDDEEDYLVLAARLEDWTKTTAAVNSEYS